MNYILGVSEEIMFLSQTPVLHISVSLSFLFFLFSYLSQCDRRKAMSYCPMSVGRYLLLNIVVHDPLKLTGINLFVVSSKTV